MPGIVNAAKKLGPVTNVEFASAIREIWKPRQGEKLGLAISGGVDSMALAFLMKGLKFGSGGSHEQLTVPINPFAFIVDHQLRPNSREEALNVSGWLRNLLDIDSDILTLQIPRLNSSSLSDHHRVERYARTYRYRALGMACRKHGIERLLLAHHRGDQSEQVIMNLIEGRMQRGGMRPDVEIPECEGMYGVHQSGGNPYTAEKSNESCRQAETGGVRLIRPLLPFPKSRLISTCEENSIPWVEDATNQDPKYTFRNAIRMVLDKQSLPQALNRHYSGALSERMGSARAKLQERVAELAKECKVRWDPRNGSVIFQIGNVIPEALQRGTRTFDEFRTTALHLVHRLVCAVSPRAKVEVRDTLRIFKRVFPGLLDPQELDGIDNKSDNSPDVIAEVYVQRIPLSTLVPRKSRKQSSDIRKWNPEHPIYKLTRTNPHSHVRSKMIKIAPSIPTQPQSSHRFLFDNRFWLRVTNPYPDQTLGVRLLWHEDVPLLVDKLDPWNRAYLRMRELLTKLAPDKTREIIPVIVELPDQPQDEKFPEESRVEIDKSAKRGHANHHLKHEDVGRVIAIPTLGWAYPSAVEAGLLWDVRYKKLPDGIPFEDISQDFPPRNEARWKKQRPYQRDFQSF